MNELLNDIKQNFARVIWLPLAFVMMPLSFLGEAATEPPAFLFLLGGGILGFTLGWAAVGLVVLLYGVLLAFSNIARLHAGR